MQRNPQPGCIREDASLAQGGNLNQAHKFLRSLRRNDA